MPALLRPARCCTPRTLLLRPARALLRPTCALLRPARALCCAPCARCCAPRARTDTRVDKRALVRGRIAGVSRACARARARAFVLLRSARVGTRARVPLRSPPCCTLCPLCCVPRASAPMVGPANQCALWSARYGGFGPFANRIGTKTCVHQTTVWISHQKCLP